MYNLQNPIEFGRPAVFQAGHRGDVRLPEIVQLRAADRDAEILSDHILDLVRLVEYGGVILGDDSVVEIVISFSARSAKNK